MYFSLIRQLWLSGSKGTESRSKLKKLRIKSLKKQIKTFLAVVKMIEK